MTLVVPLGAVEQHGPHLPLDTDTRIAAAVAEQICTRLDDASVIVAPPLAYGASGEHEGFAGTVSIGHEALLALLVEYGRSACRWAARLLFVNGHGGNALTLRSAVSRLRYEGRDVAWFPCAFADADAHAGYTETSVLLHISPELVAESERRVPGNCTPVAALLEPMRAGGVAAVSATGVLGDPRAATAAAGAGLFDAVVDGGVAAVAAWDVDENGRLG